MNVIEYLFVLVLKILKICIKFTQCYGTATIYSGSDYDFEKVLVPDLKPDHI
jgi:hypothetical protein